MPSFAGGDQVSSSSPSARVTLGGAGGAGRSSGVAGAEAALAGETPTSLVAVTVKV